MNTEKIIKIIMGKDETLPSSPKGYICRISIYLSDLRKNNVPALFEFVIDYTFSKNNPQISVSIPAGTVEEIFEHEHQFNNRKLELLMTLIDKNIIEKYGSPLSFVVFSILHEIGHWIYFCNNDFLPSEYEAKDRPYKEAVEMMSGDENELFKAYRMIPSEKASDEWALENLEKILCEVKTDLEVCD